MICKITYALKARVRNLVNDSKSWKNIFPALTRRTHFSRWEQVAVAGPPVWDGRNKIIAGFIPDGSTVIDLGCGAQTLKNYLPDGCRYQPCDLVQSSPDVIVCDFNAGQFPRMQERFDCAVSSGVLEYIKDHERFLNEYCQIAGFVILSYNPVVSGSLKIQRMKSSWLNHFSRSELEIVFHKLGIASQCLHVANHGEVIYRLVGSQVGRVS